MIILTKDNGIDIPNYDDLDNKPKINGVTLEGDLTSEELGIDLDTTRYYTKTQSDNRFQPKGNYQPAGNYLTSIPSEYVTETELNNTLNQKDYATKTYVDSAIENIEDGSVDLNDYYTKGEVDNLIDNVEVDLTGYATEQWVENKGYLTAVPSAYVTETELNNTLNQKDYATKSEIPTIPTNVSSFNNDAGYITENALNGYASENWVTENYQPAGDYLTSVPSEYITETELNEAIAGLDGNDVPYVCFLLLQSGVKDEYLGDLQAVIEAVKNKSPYFAYAYSGDDPNNYGSSIAPTRTLIPLTATYNNNYGTTDYRTGYFGYHTDIAADSTYPHLDVKINFKYDSSTQSYILNGISKNVHRYMTLEYYGEYLSRLKQDKLVSGTNIKTINGNSILGSGDLTIEGSGTAIPTMFIPQGYSGSVDLSILTPVVDAIRNNKPWIVWGDLGAAYGRYNMIECSTIGDNSITFYDNSVFNASGSSIMRYWEFNLTDGTFTLSERTFNFATTSYVDTQIGDINTILENIIG